MCQAHNKRTIIENFSDNLYLVQNTCWAGASSIKLNPYCMSNIKLHKGDITKAKVDAIVNAANPIMLGGGGVDGAIHQAAGPKLSEACRKIKGVDGIRCPFGEARITEAGDLPVKYIIHAVGPRYKQEQDPEKLLISAYRMSLVLALEHECTSIAFPALSCGAYGYPADEAAEIAVSVCSEMQYGNLQVSFYLFTQELFELWQQELDNV